MNSVSGNTYDDSLKVKDALQLYFSRYHFKDGGYHDKFFKIKVGPVYIPFPNTKSRLDAVKIHDIHHLVTEYDATFKGETEIGAWEIAAGCEKYSAAWILNFGSFLIGMFLFPRNLLRAFLRGRKTSTSLYYSTEYNEDLLNKTLGELRETIDVNSKKENSVSDYLLFIYYCVVVLLFYIATGFILILALYKLLLLFF